MHSTNFINLLADYKRFIRVRGYKTYNGNMYYAGVNEFLGYLEKRGFTDIKEITPKEIGLYMEYLSSRKNKRGGTLAINTLNHHLFALKLLFDFLLDSSVLNSSILLPAYFKSQLVERDSLSKEDIKTLFEACLDHREKAILSLAYGCGLRRSEITALNLRDVNLREGFLIVREGKNSKRREIPLTEAVKGYLRDYLVNQRSTHIKTGALPESFLLNDRGTRFTGNKLALRLKKILLRTPSNLQAKHITLHSLRHAIAEHLLENGASIEFIKEFLGHSQIDTSQVYAIKQKQRS